MADKEVAELDKQEANAEGGEESSSGGSSVLVIMGVVIAIILVVVIGVVVGTANNDANVNVPTGSPTVKPTASPTELDFTTSEFLSTCFFAERSAIFATEDYEPGEAISILNASVGNIFGFFTCFDQSLVACDIDQEEFLFEGILCEAVDPTFQCQCGQGILNVLLDGFFDGRSELGCGASIEDVQCNPAGDDLEAELLNLLHQQFFYEYINDIEGDDFYSIYGLYSDDIIFEDVENELQEFGFYVEVNDDVFADLIFECESGIDFSSCLNPITLFVCQNQGFVAELCTVFDDFFGCANPVGEIVPLAEGALECVLTDSPTANPSSSPTRNPLPLEFRPLEFFQACELFEIVSGAEDYYTPGLNTTFNGVVFGFYTCIDQTIVTCDFDLEASIFEGVFCPSIDPSFECQCDQGSLHVLEAPFEGRTELACGASSQDTSCDIVDSLLLLEFIFEVSSYAGGDDLYDLLEALGPYITLDEYLADALIEEIGGFYLADAFYTNVVDEDVFFDLTFECESGAAFSSCINEGLVFECADQAFFVESCGLANETGCFFPPGERFELQEVVCQTAVPTESPIGEPTESPTRSPTDLDFRPLEFFQACELFEIVSGAEDYYTPGLNTTFNGVVFGFYTCIDQTIVTCDFDLEASIFEGVFCPSVDPSFECQCDQGSLHVLEAPFEGRTELACGASSQDTSCDIVDSLLLLEFIFEVSSYAGGDDLYDLLEELGPNITLDEYLADALIEGIGGFYLADAFYTNVVDEDVFFDLTFECESGAAFSSCINEGLVFECADQAFFVESCGFANETGCFFPPGELFDIQELACQTPSPTFTPTRSPIDLDFKISEFMGVCATLEFNALDRATYEDGPNDGYYTSQGLINGFFTCIDKILFACDIDQENFLFDGFFCDTVDPTFDCQCGQGVLNILVDGFFDGRDEVACGASPEDVQCNPAGEDLETEILQNLQREIFYYYVNDIEGDEGAGREEGNYYTFDDLQELQDLGIYFEGTDDFLFDLIFDCEQGDEFSACLNDGLLFICSSQSFAVEICGFIYSDSCSNTPGEKVPLEDGVLQCALE